MDDTAIYRTSGLSRQYEVLQATDAVTIHINYISLAFKGKSNINIRLAICDENIALLLILL